MYNKINVVIVRKEEIKQLFHIKEDRKRKLNNTLI